MDDTPFVNDGADTSLRKAVSLLNKIEAKTGSTTITGPVTVNNEVEIKNGENAPIPVSDNNSSLTVDGTVELGATSLAALENISVTFPATQNVNVTNPGLNVSVSNLPATQPVSGTIGTFNNTLVNAGSVFNYGAVGSFGTFDAGADADYVEFRRDGGGGGFTHNLSLSLSDSPFSAGATTAATALVFNDKFPSSSLDTHAYRFSNTHLNNGTSGNFILNLRQGSTKYRYVRVDVTGGGGGNWNGVFTSYKSSGLISSGTGLDASRIQNRVPIAGVVDINSCTRELPVNDSALISSVGTTSEAAAASDLAVSSISGLFRRLLQRLTTLLPANLTVSSTRLLVDGSGVTQPVSGTVTANTGLTQPLTDTQLRAASVPISQATAANLNATVVQGTATNLRTAAEVYTGGSPISSSNALTIKTTTALGSGANVVSVGYYQSGANSVLQVSDGSGLPVRPANSTTFPVTGTFWQATQPVSGTVNTYPQQGTTATNTNFSSITSAELAPAVANRESLTVYNEGPGTLFVNVGGSCSTTSYQVRLFPGDYWEAPAGQLSLQHSGIFGTAGTAQAVQVS